MLYDKKSSFYFTEREWCLHQASSGVKCISTLWLWHQITFSHYTLYTKGNNSRCSDNDRQTLSQFIFGVEDHSLSCIDIVCPFRAPPPPRFPLSLCWMALQQTVGFLPYMSRGFLHLKVSVVVQRLPVLDPSAATGWFRTQDHVWILSNPWTKTPIYQHCCNPRCLP